ncbi:carboxy-S-adenosyl-L-methionine synthase CmoA [Psychrosphaera sp. B3R10]|uniref:carboxy-S-adenosyl-L-methionine synthase CmoA n=1 Tax=unclassified Psychrosphaera TaxID=2641570 RepID=UPI001C08EDD0|nr:MULTISPECIES: carboxy-S-adenosyl-L-methionine synthase CmoA [unclassified Psychrosphaera]MBU2881643.1 carboxy-S-adenosyl-L-methionine synthase CmoA [Psychrosphaera sp. I2R16]MBU2991102.1 carboxy-S-adenosyl-L-methionine synthase CmoA [Psychrosphaera sp. B3R10]
MRDNLYADSLNKVKDFTFDESVVEVFPDMIQRSVPGYSTMVSAIGKLAQQFQQPNSAVYDLGCSLGAATLSMRKYIDKPNCKIIALDNSVPMVERCRNNIKAYKSDVEVIVDLADILEVELQPCSFVVMNFTLQFIEPELRSVVLSKIHNALLPCGAFVMSEKLKWDDSKIHDAINNLHLDFKRANGYSELEISQKRSAIENVMKIDTEQTHITRLQQAGFTSQSIWYQCFNFASFIAIKA